MARLEHAFPGRLRRAWSSQSRDLPLTANAVFRELRQRGGTVGGRITSV